MVWVVLNWRFDVFIGPPVLRYLGGFVPITLVMGLHRSRFACLCIHLRYRMRVSCGDSSKNKNEAPHSFPALRAGLPKSECQEKA